MCTVSYFLGYWRSTRVLGIHYLGALVSSLAVVTFEVDRELQTSQRSWSTDTYPWTLACCAALRITDCCAHSSHSLSDLWLIYLPRPKNPKHCRIAVIPDHLELSDGHRCKVSHQVMQIDSFEYHSLS